LYVKDLDSGVLSRFTSTPYAAEASPTWSPDGRQLAFVSDRSGRPQVYVKALLAKTDVRLTYEGNENVAPDWGVDGRIAYSSGRGGVYEICIYDPRTRRHTQLTRGGADWEDPSWAPDGRHLVCTRTSGYRSSLYILDVLGDSPLRLKASEGDWYSPDWAAQ
jgi:TolB protein